MHINVKDLRSMSEKLFLHLQDQGIDSVNIPMDYYWNIPKGSLYNPYQQPEEFDMGQLSDDLNELHKILDGTEEPISHAFIWLAALLRSVGEEVVF